MTSPETKLPDQQKTTAATALYSSTVTRSDSLIGVEHFRAFPYLKAGHEFNSQNCTTAFSVLSGGIRKFYSEAIIIGSAVSKRDYTEIPKPFTGIEDDKRLHIGNQFKVIDFIEHINGVVVPDEQHSRFRVARSGQASIAIASYLLGIIENRRAKIRDF